MDNLENIAEFLENDNEDDNDIKHEDLNVNIGLSAVEISEIAVNDFQTSAGKMLYKMNESMKINNVNGSILYDHCKNKNELTNYLKENVLKKSVHILVNLLWNKIDDTMNNYTRKQLLKYFISLYMYHLKNVIIKNDLNENKCMQLGRKGICNIFRNECGFTIGVSTNIVDKIHHKIRQ
eukprot:58779_1